MSGMDPTTTVNDQIVDAVRTLDRALLSPDIIRLSGAGKAYQSVAQSTALAVQDATDTMRNLSTLGMTAMGVAMSQLLATGDPVHREAMTEARAIMSGAAEMFRTVGQNAAAVLSGFPHGER